MDIEKDTNINDYDRIILFYGGNDTGNIDYFAFTKNRVWKIKGKENKTYLIPFTPVGKRWNF